MKNPHLMLVTVLTTTLYSAQSQQIMPTTSAAATTAADTVNSSAKAGHCYCYPQIPHEFDTKQLHEYIVQHARSKTQSQNPYICTGCIESWEDSVRSNPALRTLLGIFSTQHTDKVTGLAAVEGEVRIMVQPEFLQSEERRIATTYTGATIPANDNNARLAQETPHFIEHMLATSPHFCQYNGYSSSLNDHHFVLRPDHKIILCIPNCKRIATTREKFVKSKAVTSTQQANASHL